MSDLTNLSEDECALLVEVLEREQRELLSGLGSIQAQSSLKDKARRQEALRQLLWRLRVKCFPTAMGDAEALMEEGSLSRG
jgi:hypothetical protein